MAHKDSAVAENVHVKAGVDDPLRRLREAIEHAAHLLPAQGPITVFIHHNTLHAFEDQPFLEGVKKGAKVFGCQPFLTEDRYRQELWKGRIRVHELASVVREGLGDRADEQILPNCSRLDLRMAMLQCPLRFGPTEELLWHIAETDALRTFRSEASAAIRSRLVAETRRWVMRDLRGGNESGRAGAGAKTVPAFLDGLRERFDSAMETWADSAWEAFTLQALWRVSCHGVRTAPAFVPTQTPTIRHRDLLRAATGADSDPPVNDLLTRFVAAFLDQGFAPWDLPNREHGFLRAFSNLYGKPASVPFAWMRGLAAELRDLELRRLGPLESVMESLEILGVAEEEWGDFISLTLLSLRGWGGMIQQVEERGDRVARPIARGSLIEFLAARLLLDRFSLAHFARESLGYAGPLSGLRDEARKWIEIHEIPSMEQRAFLVFQLAQILGWSPNELMRLSPGEWSRLMEEVETFSSVERRQAFHLAYERRFYTQALDAFALHARKAHKPVEPRYQVITCLDEREESFRRHLEEVAPDVETFGAAGFFAVPMYYRGAADAHFVPLCPIVIRPQHWVQEEVDQTHEEVHRRRAQTRKALGKASHRVHMGSRSFAFGALLSAGVGFLATIPLVARILFPRLTSRIRQMLGRVVEAPPATYLQLERHEAQPGPENGQIGFNLDEMVGMGERLLRDIGLIDGFARLVVLIGHGSFSLNNPHKSAYDCGACGGSPGAPNGRAMSRILNDPRIREGLAQRGISIPTETWFVGGFHNTCNDSATYFDVELNPESHRHEFEAIRNDVELALERNAHERCRRFISAPLTQSFMAARQHVEARAEDLAQTRPELGHATNTLCQVGRRKWTRGLYFDRRMFLTSYDPTQDDENATILTRTMSAIFPVCGGINLEYFFSHTDSPGYGCGTKLPHNVSALLGVMDGPASDLRTGLPWQMVEIHEPVRLLIIIEAKASTVLRMLERNPAMCKMGINGWVQIAVQDPDTAKIQVFRNGEFHDYEPEADALPQAASSVDWYRGCRDHLEFAEIEAQ